MQLAGLQDLDYIPKENLLNINCFTVIFCYKCLNLKHIICICKNNDYYFDYICKNMLNCKKLTLQNISINFITSKISNLQKLEDLCLANNKIMEIPKEIKSLQYLTSLNLANNKIEEIPDFLYSLTKLNYLNLYNNKIRYIDDDIGNLINLEKLIINNNMIELFPNTLANLQNLTKLCIDATNVIFINNDKMLITVWKNDIVIPKNIFFLNILAANKTSNLDNLPYYLEYLKLGIVCPIIKNLPMSLRKIKIHKKYEKDFDNLKIPFGCELLFYII